MRLSQIDVGTFITLDSACEGVLTSLQDYCASHSCEADLSVLTHLEGLEEGEMKLFLVIVKDRETVDYAIARMEGSAQIIGWNIYLQDILESAKNHLDKALRTEANLN
jgi:hypothetical protein